MAARQITAVVVSGASQLVAGRQQLLPLSNKDGRRRCALTRLDVTLMVDHPAQLVCEEKGQV